MNIKIDEIIVFIIILMQQIFFIITAMFGYAYLGSENSNSYTLFCASMFILSFILYFKNSVFERKIRFKEILVLFIAVIILAFAGLEYILYQKINLRYIMTVLYFVCFSISSILAGLYCVKENIVPKLVKYFDVYNIVAFTVLFSIVMNNFIKNAYFQSAGAFNYQGISYILGFTGGINFYLIFYGEKYQRFKFAQTKVFLTFQILLFIGQFTACLLTGGRGGFILFMTYIIFILLIIVQKKQIKKIPKLIIIFLIILLFFLVFSNVLINNSLFENSIDRIVSFISPTGGINWEGTSQRNIVYLEAIAMILEKPLIGYGFWGYLNTPFGIKWGYPHNFFLEILLQGGVIYFLFSLFFLSVCIFKMKKMLIKNLDYEFLLLLAIYPIVNLMMSGTYVTNSLFWFVIIILVTASNNRNNEKLY